MRPDKCDHAKKTMAFPLTEAGRILGERGLLKTLPLTGGLFEREV